MLVAVPHGCPCGDYSDLTHEGPIPRIQRYHSRIYGPRMDRIGIHITDMDEKRSFKKKRDTEIKGLCCGKNIQPRYLSTFKE